jgi:hypothetical protein
MKVKSLDSKVVKNAILGTLMLGAAFFMYSSTASANYHKNYQYHHNNWYQNDMWNFKCSKICDQQRCYLIVDYRSHQYPFKLYLDSGFKFRGHWYTYYHRYFVYEGNHYHTYYYFTYYPQFFPAYLPPYPEPRLVTAY